MNKADRVASFENVMNDIQRALDDFQMLMDGLRARDPGAFRPFTTPLAALAVPHGDQAFPGMNLTLRYLFDYLKSAQELWFKLPPADRWCPPERRMNTVAKLEDDIARMEKAIDLLELRLAEAREQELSGAA